MDKFIMALIISTLALLSSISLSSAQIPIDREKIPDMKPVLILCPIATSFACAGSYLGLISGFLIGLMTFCCGCGCIQTAMTGALLGLFLGLISGIEYGVLMYTTFTA